MGGPLNEVVALGLLAVTVLAAATVQTAIGFGAMLICVTLGAFAWTIPELTAMLVPLTTLQTAWIALRHRHDIAWGLLIGRVFPWMGLGVATSLAFVGAEPQPWMRPTLGVMILVLAVRELGRSRGDTSQQAPQGRVASTVGLVVAGLVHGVFATGGPPLVWALGQEPLSKSAFRTTLTAVWAGVNSALIVAFALRGQLTADSLGRTAMLLVPLVLGIGLGEVVHARVDERRFRLLVWGLLAVAAGPLALG